MERGEETFCKREHFWHHGIRPGQGRPVGVRYSLTAESEVSYFTQLFHSVSFPPFIKHVTDNRVGLLRLGLRGWMKMEWFWKSWNVRGDKEVAGRSVGAGGHGRWGCS